jgi:Tfp pilus assembly protein PilX
MNKLIKKDRLKTDENGVVSFFVTLIIMIILSIVVIGFSQISRSEARESLDRQLSTQAFYAAESGVNDAYSIISNDVNTGITPQSADTSCAGSVYSTSDMINASSETGYTCLLVDVTPTVLTYHPATSQASIVNLQSANPGDLSTLKIEWENDNSSGETIDNTDGSCTATRYAALGVFLPNVDWSTSTATCPPVLQVDLVPVATPITEAALAAGVKTFFLDPNNVAGNGNFGAIQSGQVIGAQCTTTCQFTVTGLNSPEYYAKIQYIYGSPPTINLSATDSNGKVVSFEDDQAQIDSTGKSEDVLRRIQVVVSLTSSVSGSTVIPSAPDYAIESNTTLCKRILTGNSGPVDFGYVNIPDSVPLDVSAQVNIGEIYDLPGNPSEPNPLPASTTDPCQPY